MINADTTGPLVAYLRVSTDSQDAQLQLDALTEAGCTKFFTDKASGKNTDRPELTKALDYLREGDRLVVWKLDRLGRSTKDVLTIAEDLYARGVSLRILTGTLAGSYSPSGEGKFFFTMMVAFAELERDMIVERTKAGLAAAKAQGKVGGRPKAMDTKMIRQAQALKGEGKSYGAIAKTLGVGQATVYRALTGMTG
ncbi:recombinase family protein [Streptomyces sp. NPDC059757]|uniref:recombinase family protein n=1 Tax=Streptomyces sp. NPDC059757 TaxID=3346935 RepID=UPI003667B5EA